MVKLFAEDPTDMLEVGTITRYSEPKDGVDFDSLAEAEDSISLVTESFGIVASRIDDINEMTLNYQNKKVGSLDYFTAMEAYSPILKNIASNLGVKHRIPAMEDFTSAYGTQAAHDVAMEGIGEFLKSLWAKLKDLLNRFFKKINEFFRRLMKANLEIDTYDKYIPGMIKDIKAKKLECEDKDAKVKSKLPAMLANPGMSSMDDVFLVNIGLPRMGNLTAVVSEKIIPSMHAFCSTRMPELKAALLRIGDINFTGDEGAVETSIEKYKSDIEKAVEDIVQGFCDNITEANELSENAYETLSDSLATSRVSDLTIRSLVDSKNTFARLPKNFNVYMAVSTEKDRVFAVANTEEEQTLDDLRAATDFAGLTRINDFYQQYKKGFNIRALDTACKGLEDSVEDFTKFMQNAFRNKINEALNKTESTIDGMVMLSLAKVLVAFPEEVLDVRGMSSTLHKRVPGHPALGLVINSQRGERPMFDEAEVMEYLNRLDEESIIEAIKDANVVLNAKGVDLIQTNNISASKPLAGRVAKVVADLEKFIMSMLQTLQVVHRGLSATTMSIYTESRYELAKYIYDSARLYK